jgi:hypothetical protein
MALKTIQNAASSIAKAALPKLGTSKAYKEFQKAAAEGTQLLS